MASVLSLKKRPLMIVYWSIQTSKPQKGEGLCEVMRMKDQDKKFLKF